MNTVRTAEAGRPGRPARLRWLPAADRRRFGRGRDGCADRVGLRRRRIFRQGGHLAHAHGLGIDPGAGTVYVASHDGRFLLAPGQRVERVGDGRLDLMGFTVAGEGRFFASGHPPIDESTLVVPGKPHHCWGLPESRDAGATWGSLSLPGEADFHVLAFAGGLVYGYDGTSQVVSSGRAPMAPTGSRRVRPPPGRSRPCSRRAASHGPQPRPASCRRRTAE